MPADSDNPSDVSPEEVSGSDLIDRWTALLAGAWSLLAVAAGALGVRQEWSGSGSGSPTLAPALVLLGMFPVAAVWVIMTVLGLVAHRRTVDRKLYASVVGVLVVGSTLLLQVPASSAAEPHTVTPRLLASALLASGGLGGLGATLWFFRFSRG